MAYAALVSLAQTIHLILNHHHNFISPQFQDELITIHKHVLFLQEFLENFPDKDNRFEGSIKEATLAAEDVIELLLSKQMHESFLGPSESEIKDMERELSQEETFRCIGDHKSGALTSLLGFFFGSAPKPEHRTWEDYESLCHDLHNLNKVAKDFALICGEIVEVKNSITGKDVRLCDPAATSSSSSSSSVTPIHKEVMIGCEDDLMEIKSRLCGESSKLEVVPIVGMGGIGKTTLARSIYDDQLIIEYFQIRVWVTVSQDYSVPAIVSSLLVSMKVIKTRDESVQAHHVYQHLKGRSFLVVLDDVWSTSAWDDLKMMFPDDGNGSRIMLTTRLSDVASYPDSYSPVHELHLLDEDQSWNMLRQKVFQKDRCPIELEDVGKTISRSCRGLPLAIAVISGLLAVQQTQSAWKNIAEDVKSAISAADDEQLDKILSLSYTRLPRHLRPCFLYMAGFPEDLAMPASEIIRLWVAEGFLKPNTSKSFEETAEECLTDLVKRSLILVTKRKSNGRIKTFSMHDLMREVCIRKAHEENFILQVSRSVQERIKTSRRLCIFNLEAGLLEDIVASRVRTVIHAWRFLDCSFCLGYFRLARIVNMSEPVPLAYTSLSDEIFELFHLRYLGLQFSGCKIPAAISNLQNLQTLVIIADGFDFFGSTVKLPEEIWRMRQLRHIVAYLCDLPVASEEEPAFALEDLQTLSRIRNFVCTSKLLKVIPNLKKLGLSYKSFKEDTYEAEYELHNLVHLQQLEKLKLQMDFDFPNLKKVRPCYPNALKELTLSGLGIPWKDMTIVGSLPDLRVLKLRDYACEGHTWETTEGEFPRLILLKIEVSDLQHWITESDHFPRLECLVLHHLYRLTEIPDGIGEIPTLQLIEVGSDDLAKSAKQIQEEQLDNGNDALQVHVIRD